MRQPGLASPLNNDSCPWGHGCRPHPRALGDSGVALRVCRPKPPAVRKVVPPGRVGVPTGDGTCAVLGPDAGRGFSAPVGPHDPPGVDTMEANVSDRRLHSGNSDHFKKVKNRFDDSWHLAGTLCFCVFFLKL